MTGNEWVNSLSLDEQVAKMEEFMSKENLSQDEVVQFLGLQYAYLQRLRLGLNTHQHANLELFG